MELPERKELRVLYSPAGIASASRAKPGLIKAIRLGEVKQHIYIYAASGFGKTASVLRWIKDTPGQKAWISLCETDNAPDMFFTRLILAFLSIQPDNASLMGKLRRAEPGDNIPLLAEEAVYCLPTGVERAFITFDSFEHITDEELIRIFVKVIRALPSGFSVVLIGRQEPHELFSDIILRNLMSLIHKEKIVL